MGFESTAMYGEESRDPKRVVPRATLISVVGIGLFYVFVSWMIVSGNGVDHAVAVASGAVPGKEGNSLFFDLPPASGRGCPIARTWGPGR
ncbi:hypothetical protein ACFRMQ_30110 [Kitasatospora sp. NPDC056783]|uniref:hypothetical protein n=1 Tax=Kitasatospora sp. NPDC056783 TaxID=3345943 RepID=UPI00368A788E